MEQGMERVGQGHRDEDDVIVSTTSSSRLEILVRNRDISLGETFWLMQRVIQKGDGFPGRPTGSSLLVIYESPLPPA